MSDNQQERAGEKNERPDESNDGCEEVEERRGHYLDGTVQRMIRTLSPSPPPDYRSSRPSRKISRSLQNMDGTVRRIVRELSQSPPPPYRGARSPSPPLRDADGTVRRIVRTLSRSPSRGAEIEEGSEEGRSSRPRRRSLSPELQNADGTVKRIVRTLSVSPSPPPLPQGDDDYDEDVLSGTESFVRRRIRQISASPPPPPTPPSSSVTSPRGRNDTISPIPSLDESQPQDPKENVPYDSTNPTNPIRSSLSHSHRFTPLSSSSPPPVAHTPPRSPRHKRRAGQVSRHCHCAGCAYSANPEQLGDVTFGTATAPAALTSHHDAGAHQDPQHLSEYLQGLK